MTEQPIEIERYLKFTLVYILTTILADGIGLTLGSLLDPVVSIAPNVSNLYISYLILYYPQNGTFVGAIVSAFMLAFSGFLALSSHIAKPMKILMYLSSMSYSLEALVLSIYDYNRSEMECPESVIYCHYKSVFIINYIHCFTFQCNVSFFAVQIIQNDHQ